MFLILKASVLVMLNEADFVGGVWTLKCLFVNKLKETQRGGGSSSQKDAVFGAVRPDHPRHVLGREEARQLDVTQTPGDAAMADAGGSGAEGDTPALTHLIDVYIRKCSVNVNSNWLGHSSDE